MLHPPQERKNIVTLLDKLSKLQSVYLKLQNAEEVMLRYVRVLF